MGGQLMNAQQMQKVANPQEIHADVDWTLRLWGNHWEEPVIEPRKQNQPWYVFMDMALDSNIRVPEDQQKRYNVEYQTVNFGV